MAVSHQPVFTQTPQYATGRVAAANTARDGSGTIVTIATVGSNGARLFQITTMSAQATAAVNSAMVIRYWYSTDAGTTWRFIENGELAIAAITASTTVVGAVAFQLWDNLLLPASAKIGVTQSIYASAADQMDSVAKYQDL